MDFDLVLFLITFTKKEDADTNGSLIINHKLCVVTGRFIPPNLDVSCRASATGNGRKESWQSWCQNNTSLS